MYWTIAAMQVGQALPYLLYCTCMDHGVSYAWGEGCTGLLRPCGAGSPLSPLPVWIMWSVMGGGGGQAITPLSTEDHVVSYRHGFFPPGSGSEAGSGSSGHSFFYVRTVYETSEITF